MKLNILILEDEYFIRKSLVQKVSRSGLAIKSIVDVETTEEATAVITTSVINILLCDIHLGTNNGLDFIEIIKNSQPNCKVIIISGHEDFKYAMRAIDLDVCSYLLKPVAATELFEALQKAQKALVESNNLEKKDYSWQQKNIETDMRIAFESKDLKAALSFFQDYQPNLRFGCIYLYLPNLSKDLLTTTISRFILMLQPYQVQQDFIFFEMRTHEYCCAFLYSSDIKQSAEFSNYLQQCWRKLQLNNPQLIGCCAGISNYCTNLFEAYNQANRAMRHHIFFTQNPIIYFDKIEPRTLYQLPDEDKILFEYAVKSRRYSVFCEFLDGFYETTLKKEMRYSYFQLIYHHFMQHILFQMKVTDPSIQLVKEAYLFDSVNDAMEYLKKLYRSCVGQNKDEDKYSSEQLVYSLKELIDQDYAMDISLERFCFTHKVNPSFLSQQFKHLVKTSFQDYLIQVRISNAKLLLAQHRYKIKDIAEMCGFANQHYFSTLFKKRTGLSPKEFYASNKNNNI